MVSARRGEVVRAAKQFISMPVFPELSIQVIPSFADLQVQEIIQRQSQTCNTATEGGRRKPRLEPDSVEEAYERCRKICEEYGKTYYLAWGRRIGDLEVLRMAPPFKDLIEGMRMDMRKFRYWIFHKLYLDSYYAGGTFGLMSVPVIGIAPDSLIPVQSVYEGAIHFGTANQLTNILRDVGEDATLGRVYLPQDELAHFGLSNNNIFARKVTDQWREFMKEQIARARIYFSLAEEGVS
ncbi:hypothetical protein ACFX14_005631 [Malus domestica]